jgi:acetyltransferase-like isoleucine patch superfamily enzyme
MGLTFKSNNVVLLLNKAISKWKGCHYEIDERVPASYLIGIVTERVFMLINGKLSGIKSKGFFFLSGKAVVKAKSKLKLGKSVTIDRGCFINALSTEGIILDDNVSVGRNTTIIGTGNLQFLGKGMTVGKSVGLGTHSFYGCAGGIEIGRDTIIGDFVSFHAENHIIDDMNVPIRLQGVYHKGIKIGENCWIGAKVTILDGVTIENGCVIAAGALVTAGLYTANGIYGGVPAKLLRKRGNV